MTRDDQIKAVERGFKDLASFAAGSWSNLAIVDRVNALHLMARDLYPPVLVPGPPLPPPPQPTPEPAPPKAKRKRRVRESRLRELQTYEPVQVTASTRWG